MALEEEKEEEEEEAAVWCYEIDDMARIAVFAPSHLIQFLESTTWALLYIYPATQRTRCRPRGVSAT